MEWTLLKQNQKKKDRRYEWRSFGNTQNHKHLFKKHGWTFDNDNKTWVIYDKTEEEFKWVFELKGVHTIEFSPVTRLMTMIKKKLLGKA